MTVKYLYCFAAVMAISATMSSCSKDEPIVYKPSTEVGKALVENGYVAQVIRDTCFFIADGVSETDLQVQMMDGYIEQLFIIKADTKVPGVKLRVGMPYDNNDHSGGWRRQIPSEMVQYLDKPGERVAALINGDFFDVSNFMPRGPIHRQGITVNSEFHYSENVPQQALAFVGITDDGKMTIQERDKYPQYKSMLVECTGAGFIFLKDGVIVDTPWKARDPRTGIGYTDDGIIYTLTADGRKVFAGAGLTYFHMANIFRGLGCSNAVNLDGGGSSQLLVRHPVARVYQIRNSPADGKERAIGNTWTVVVDEP